MANRRRSWVRRWRVGSRDTRLLLRQSRGALLAFAVAVVGRGGMYYLLGGFAGEQPPTLAAATYHALALIFLQPIFDFPQA